MMKTDKQIESLLQRCFEENHSVIYGENHVKVKYLSWPNFKQFKSDFIMQLREDKVIAKQTN